MDILGPSNVAYANVKMVQPLWKIVKQFLKKLTIHLSYDSSCYTPTYLSKRNENRGLHKDLYVNVHSSIVHRSLNLEITQTPSPGKWIHKVWSIQTLTHYLAMKSHKVLLHATTQMDLNNMLNERRKTQKTTTCIVPLV